MKTARILFIFICLYPLCALIGCGSVDKSMASWMGRHVDELRSSWGMPQEILHNEEGGLIYVYYQPGNLITFKKEVPVEDPPPPAVSNDSKENLPEDPHAQSEKTTFETTTYKKRSMLWVDEDGKIYDWAWGVW
jgi:hypothetical protein